MGDIDFDELDKAVNSVMKQTSGLQPATDGSTAEQQSDAVASDATLAPSPVDPAQQQYPTEQVNEVTSQEPVVSAPEVPAELEQAVSPTLTNDDTIADTTPSLTPEESAVELSSLPDSAVLAPTEQEAVPEATTDDVSVESTVPQAEEAPLEEAKPVKRSGRFMDVVHPSSDMANASNVPDMSSSTDRKGAAVMPPSQSESIESTIASSTMQTAKPQQPTTPPDTPEPKSPFLPDAKVEKRPLGPITADASSTNSDQGMPEQPDAKPDTRSKNAPASVPLPDELKGELVSIDAAEHGPMTPSGTANEQFQTPGQAAEQTADEHAAIFSPDAHAPLAHPKKKRSSIVIIAVIVGLIVVGIAGAVALYMFDVL